MAIKRNRKDYGCNETAVPVFLKIKDPKTRKWKVLGWFSSMKSGKKKAWSFLDKDRKAYYDQTNYGTEWEIKLARDVKNPKWPFGKIVDIPYLNAVDDQLFLDQHSRI
tara:strand:- start:616 stop:939 length:324 start_codon:yes stop_codon:yes gene_type:complete